MEKPGFVIGNIAKGKDLWDRQKEMKTIWKAVEKSSVLLKAPRRFGKTSIMYRIYEKPKNGYKVFFYDAEGINHPLDFICALMSEILKDSIIRRKLKLMADSIKRLAGQIDEIEIVDLRFKIKEEIKSDWKTKGESLISSLSGYKGKIIFLIDELPVLINRIADKHNKELAQDFLHWFRGIRQMPELSHIRWVAGGSIGIEHILEKVKAGTKAINDFQIIRVGVFSEKDGQEYIKALLENEGKLKKALNKIADIFLEIVGAPVPYFIQILAYESLNEMRRLGKKSLSKEIIKKAYYEEVLGPASRTYFEHYFTRLKDYYDGEMELIAKRLILEIARTGKQEKKELFKLFRQLSKGELSDEKFSYLMADLENDFYVSYDFRSKTYKFTTNVLKDWWLRYYDLVEE